MVKTKASTSRTFDHEGYRRRAGCLCFRDEKEEEVLLVSSSRHPDRWVVPAGGVEPGEEVLAAAIREVMEEASVRGQIGRYIGMFQNDKSRSRTFVYVMFVTEVLNQVNVESKQQRWFPVSEAIAALKHRPVQQSYFEQAQQTKKGRREEPQELPQMEPL